MTFAYDKNIVLRAQRLMGSMLDFSVYGLNLELKKVYDDFMASPYATKVERGISSVVMGMSGVELAYRVTDMPILPEDKMNEYITASFRRSQEYWAGWAVAYFQWQSMLSFREIAEIRDIEAIKKMYSPYHEMDIESFCDRMRAIYFELNTESRLKTVRKRAGMSQSQLAKVTGIPLKTIQQYEQRQKNINHARVDYLISLSRALSCDIELLIEKIEKV